MALPYSQALRLLAHLRVRGVARARALVEASIAAHSPEWAYLRLLMPAVSVAGELFVKGTISGAECERITADLFELMEAARQRLVRRPGLGRSLFATHLPGFAHSVGLTSICHWLERDGWEVTRPLPVPALGELAEQIIGARPGVVAISCSLPKHILHARRLIAQVRSRGFGGPIWIGGTPLNASPTLFGRSGADYTAKDIVAFTRALARQYGYATATPADLT